MGRADLSGSFAVHPSVKPLGKNPRPRKYRHQREHKSEKGVGPRSIQIAPDNHPYAGPEDEPKKSDERNTIHPHLRGPHNSGDLTMFAAIRRVSSTVNCTVNCFAAMGS